MTQPADRCAPRVLNKRTDGVPPEAVYVGRPSKWGNPYRLENNSREQAIVKFKGYALGSASFCEAVRRELRGKDLVCHCAPLPCHATVLLEIANGE